MNKLINTVLVVMFVGCTFANKSFYSFSVKKADGKELSLKKYAGQVVLLVNVASECGYTDNHYKGLVKAKNMLKTTGKFEILAFPCNQFGAQEPKGITDIIDFAKKTYDVNFPILDKIDVVGDNAADVYKFITEKAKSAPTWNFWKYLINHRGEITGVWGPTIPVEDIFIKLRAAVDEAIVAEQNSKMPATLAKPPPPATLDGPTKPRSASTPDSQAPGAPSSSPPGAPSSSPLGAPSSGPTGKSAPKEAKPPAIKPPAGNAQKSPGGKPSSMPSGAKPPSAKPPLGQHANRADPPAMKPPKHDDL